MNMIRVAITTISYSFIRYLDGKTMNIIILYQLQKVTHQCKQLYFLVLNLQKELDQDEFHFHYIVLIYQIS